MTTTMKTLFKGAGPGTHWHVNDPRIGGFTLSGALSPTVNATVNHITAFSVNSPYLSFSTSFAVAREYALWGPAGPATQANPGYVYQVDLSVLSAAPALIDPVQHISSSNGHQPAHSHNGGYELIAEVAQVDPPTTTFTRPYHQNGSTCHPTITDELQALIRAIRDAEILIHGAVPHGAVVYRHVVYT